jgi:RNA polymerase sigma-70 factor, ECF subfamily
MDDPQPPDPILAGQAKKNPRLFLELYQRHYKRVYVYHLARTGNEQDAQDLTSETFLAALDSIAAFRPERGKHNERSECSFAAWLFGIAHHKLADFFQKRVSQSPLEEVDGRPAADPPPEQAAMQSSDLTRLRQVLALLPEERADALSLRFFSDLSLREVAQVMDKKEAAVKMLIYRGLQELRDRLGPVALEEL